MSTSQMSTEPLTPLDIMGYHDIISNKQIKTFMKEGNDYTSYQHRSVFAPGVTTVTLQIQRHGSRVSMIIYEVIR